MRMPTSKSGGAKFRGPTSSHEYNTNEDEKYLELIELYKQSNSTLLSLREAHQVVLSENVALHDYISMLEERMAALEDKLKSISEASVVNRQFFKTSFVQDMSVNFPKEFQNNQVTDPRCDIDLQNRYVTIPLTNQIPKTYLKDGEGNITIPSELKVKIGRTSTKGKVTDNNILNAFDGNEVSFWRRSVSYDSPSDIPKDGEDVIVEIELPTQMASNLNINTICLAPHPERGIQIKNIEAHYNNGWQSISGFEQQDITSVNSREYSPRRKWFFPSIPVQKIRITLVQKNSINLGGKTVFILGAQEIGVYLSMFEPSGGMILTPFEMEGIYNIESIEHVFINRLAFSYPQNLEHMLEQNIFDYEIYAEEADMTLRPLLNSDWTSQTANRLWIKTHLYPDPNNGVNPCLHAVRLHYTKV
ncbi:hypothetical protein KC480_05245 [Bacillus velezensis]|uniref:hypothetical protein n=1 Tax=Bacillus velezensis TaxID=492670 RepID=UPI001E4DD8C5|nr:hypothetical protein [Bacillus velezensis]MCD7910930.1 hypothetical protein [Bacillus velezensis]